MTNQTQLERLQEWRTFLFDCLKGNEVKRAALKVMFRSKNRVSTARINGAIDMIEYQIRVESILPISQKEA